MGHKKLVRFAAIKTYPHVLENPENMPGRWADFFKNDKPLTLELACGKGEYTVGLSAMHPTRNFLGVDLKGNRIYVGAKKTLELGQTNAGFLRTQIDAIATYFAAHEVAEIWITFPDPQLRVGNIKKRLTHPKFLRLYQQFLQTNGLVHLKTDSPVLYGFTKQVIELYGCGLVKDYDDVRVQATEPELLQITTHYEGLDIAQSGKVHYLCFKLPPALPLEKDDILKQLMRETEHY
ncbi:MAG: tRNA (guanosine(46)-N7)-methyltransferase TrmB [Bacteroidetes bacterium]|nr:MAG: tRNA (guanosine(46)-N7)-methyltransferase TrmB [Bacteroidota bacterium]